MWPPLQYHTPQEGEEKVLPRVRAMRDEGWMARSGQAVVVWCGDALERGGLCFLLLPPPLSRRLRPPHADGCQTVTALLFPE